MFRIHRRQKRNLPQRDLDFSSLPWHDLNCMKAYVRLVNA